MRFPLLALAFLLAASNGTASAQSTSPAGPLTLAEAMRLAETANPAVRAREAQLAAAEGARREAQPLLFNNPELSTERTRRRSGLPDGRANEWTVGIAQPISTGGAHAYLVRSRANHTILGKRIDKRDLFFIGPAIMAG